MSTPEKSGQSGQDNDHEQSAQGEQRPPEQPDPPQPSSAVPVRGYALVPAEGDDAAIVRALTDPWRPWRYDPDASRAVPDDYRVISREQLLDPSDLNGATRYFRDELSGFGVEPTGTLSAAPDDDVLGAGGGAEALTASPSAGDIANLFQVAVGQSAAAKGGDDGSDGAAPPGAAGPGTTTNGATGNAEVASGSTSESKTGSAAAPPAPPSAAPVIAAAIPAFPDPAGLWSHLEAKEANELAKAEIKHLGDERIAFGRRAEWGFAPELVLLDALEDGERRELAEQLLRVRSGLTTADDKTRDARAEREKAAAELAREDIALAKKNVELTGERVQLAKKGVELTGELLEHMKRWRALSAWGMGVLLATTAFSMAAVAYLLVKLIPDGKIDDVAAPIMIFVLALFAISPAVLLLRERPLEGLDKWSPGGGSDGKEGEGGEGGEGEGSSGEGDGKGATGSG